jgi:hypothetical protein
MFPIRRHCASRERGADVLEEMMELAEEVDHQPAA